VIEETPAERRTRHRAARREVVGDNGPDRLDRARQLMRDQREERRATVGVGRSRRAPAMSVDERRATIVEVALPLLVEHGGNVKTSEIAAAAGIAEGTLFRAFRDKKALFVACMRAAMEADAEVAQIQAVDRDQPLADRLTQGVEAVAGYQDRLWAVMSAMRSSGVDPRTDSDTENEKHEHHDGPPKVMIRISQAMADLFGDDSTELLRVSPELAARLLLGLVFSNRMLTEGFGDTVAELSDLVDLFLYGTVRTAQERTADGGRNTDG
jgi:AcrR family transcriptional regulator